MEGWEKDVYAVAQGLLLKYYNADPASGVPYEHILQEGLERVGTIVRRGQGLSPNAVSFCQWYFAHYGSDAGMEAYNEVREAYDAWVPVCCPGVRYHS